MPIKSESQRKRLQRLVAEGKLSQEKLDKWEAETPAGKLPERVGKSRQRGTPKPAGPSYTKKRFGLK